MKRRSPGASEPAALRRLTLLLALLAVAFAARWLWVASQVGAGFAAHVVCSLHFVSGQAPEALVERYVQHETWPLGWVLSLDTGADEIGARVLGVERARAVYRAGRGCTQVWEGFAEPQPGPTAPAALDARAAWPEGAAGPGVPAPPAIERAIDRAFREPGAGTRRVTTAVVVARGGRLVAERYAPGYGPGTPLLSWSMAKSVLATLVGLALEEERLALEPPGVLPEWRAPADARRFVTLDQLLRMSSGLQFDETYGPTSQASVMLFARPDAAAYASALPLAAPPDAVWNYSSGTANLLARALRDSFGGDTVALLRWANERLFAPAGITSALLETDASGTPIGSSFVFMTARDWARFGELHRRNGHARGRRVLPAGWVAYVTTPTPPSNGEYGAHWWLNRGSLEDPDTPSWPALPPDTFAARGHNGQFVLVVPSEQLVVVRLGLTTPSGGNDGAQELAAEVIRHYRGGDAAAGG